MKSEPSRTCTIGAGVEKLNHASLTTEGAKQVPGSQKFKQKALLRCSIVAGEVRCILISVLRLTLGCMVATTMIGLAIHLT